MFFVEEEGTLSSLRGVRDVIEARGLFCALYTDRGSHYWHTGEAGGKVDKVRLTQFGRAMKQPGIESSGPGFLDRILPSLSGFLQFRLPVGLAAN